MGGFWIFAALALVVLSAPLNSPPLLLTGTVILLLALISRWWARYSLVKVEYRHWLSSYRIFVGEDVEFTVQITNQKFLPLPWVHVTDELPRDVAPIHGRLSPAPDQSRGILSSLLSMSWYHRTSRHYTLRARHRGHYFIGPVRIRSGDLFGMFTSEINIERDQYISVYPPVLPLASTQLPTGEPYGSIRARKTLVDDITRPMGSREYAAGDSLRYIHWNATAHTGKLQTKVFDASTTANFVLMMGVRTVEPPLQGTVPHLLELGVLTTTALTNYALEQGYNVGVYVNQTGRLTSQLMKVPPARDDQQLMRVLEVMAQVHSGESIPLADLILEESRRLPRGTTLAVVTALPDEDTISTLIRLRRSGWSVALVHLGGTPSYSANSPIPTYTVPENFEWQNLEEILIQ